MNPRRIAFVLLGIFALSSVATSCASYRERKAEKKELYNIRPEKKKKRRKFFDNQREEEGFDRMWDALMR